MVVGVFVCQARGIVLVIVGHVAEQCDGVQLKTLVDIQVQKAGGGVGGVGW